MNPLDGLTRLAVWCAYTSGVGSIFGIVFLIAFFTAGGVFGPLNDIAVIVQYTLMLPIAIKVYKLVRPYGPVLSQIATLIGIAGMLAVIVLQTLLVAGVLPFNQQIVMVSAAFLVVLVWFLLTGYLGRNTDKLPKGIILHILAELYFGYPVWAFSLGRRSNPLFSAPPSKSIPQLSLSKSWIKPGGS